MRVDLKVSPQRTSWSSFANTCIAADRMRLFTGIWAFDHLGTVASGGSGDDEVDGCFEGWTALSAIAASTSFVRLGLLVSAVHYRNVGLLAQMIATLDHVSGGRIEVGLGAGNNAEESVAFGLSFGTPGERTRHLDEYVESLKLLLTGEPTTFHGEFVQLRDATCAPSPLQQPVPVLVGGKGERGTLRTAGSRCDGWNYSTGTPEEFAHKLDVLKRHSASAGRADLVRSTVQVRVGNDPEDALTEAREYLDVGATDIVLYINPLPGRLAAAAYVASLLQC